MADVLRRLAELEERVDRLVSQVQGNADFPNLPAAMTATGADLQDMTDDRAILTEAARIKRAEGEVRAVKYYRERTRAGLAEAVQVVGGL